MKFKTLLLTLIAIFISLGIFIYVEPSITGFVIQERFMISDVKVSALEFDQKIKVEQFDDHEVKFDGSLYHFTVDPEFEQDIDYVLIDFIVDSSQMRGYTKEDISLYYYKDGWLELDTEFTEQNGRFYYYKGKSEEFGLFVVAPGKVKERIVPLVSKDDLVLFALIPMFFIVFLFSCFSYSFVKIIQRVNYRIYLLLKKLALVLVKFGLSFGIVVLILGLLSPEAGDVSNISLIYYAVIPLILFSLFTNIVLDFVLWIHRLILGNRVYKILRNSFWLFAFSLIVIYSFLIKFVPDIEGSLTKSELVIYGLLPLVIISFSFVFVFYLFYALVKKIVVRT